jgi:hypothetical protein
VGYSSSGSELILKTLDFSIPTLQPDDSVPYTAAHDMVPSMAFHDTVSNVATHNTISFNATGDQVSNLFSNYRLTTADKISTQVTDDRVFKHVIHGMIAFVETMALWTSTQIFGLLLVLRRRQRGVNLRPRQLASALL